MANSSHHGNHHSRQSHRHAVHYGSNVSRAARLPYRLAGYINDAAGWQAYLDRILTRQ